MARRKLSSEENREIRDAVAHFDEHRLLFDGFAKSIVGYLRDDKLLSPYIHFIKYRLKSSERLGAKLRAKARAKKSGGRVGITRSNLFQSINDLAGIRILHLHTNQIDEMNKQIRRILEDNKIKIVEGPVVHCWDRDYENLFKGFGIPTKKVGGEANQRESMYTSVHYIVEANQKSKITFELQVRTLADELWAEVSHRVEYEEKDPDKGVHDQLKVLARLTSASTRLVDCIFDTFSKETPTPRSRSARDRRPRIQKQAP
jgi:putative GTP pyrophosphokinase